MKKREIGTGVLRQLIIGLLVGLMAGATIAALWFLEEKQKEAATEEPIQHEPKPTTWPPASFYSPSGWSYLTVDENGWSTGEVGSFEDLDNFYGRVDSTVKEIAIPIFPDVYRPQMGDKAYYDAILESDIEAGDKVLVIGTGSGADSWMVSQKSQSLVYVVEINPMAVVNAKTTARLAGFRIEAVTGDIRKTKLPDDFKDFDFVLWNMPYLQDQSTLKRLIGRNFFDGDDGSILNDFLAMLPNFLKEGGKAILLNSIAAEEVIKGPGVVKKTGKDCTLFIVPREAIAGSVDQVKTE